MRDMMHTPDSTTIARALAPLAFFADERTDGDTLDDAARDEKDYARERLRDELGREPTDAEIDEWLREHTESY